jgi:hypothetical protein
MGESTSELGMIKKRTLVGHQWIKVTTLNSPSSSVVFMSAPCECKYRSTSSLPHEAAACNGVYEFSSATVGESPMSMTKQNFASASAWLCSFCLFVSSLLRLLFSYLATSVYAQTAREKLHGDVVGD